MSHQKTRILDNHQVNQKINRIAYQLYERFLYEEKVIVVGIARQGYVVAQKISEVLNRIAEFDVELHELSMNKQAPASLNYTYSGNSGELAQANVVLIDDVLNSGQTLIYAVKFLLNEPIKQLVTAVLVDRIHRKFPIKADYVGLSLSTTFKEHISVEFDNELNTTVYLQ